jgi:hypothetical protein
MKKLFITFLTLIVFSGFTFAGTIKEELQKMAEDNAVNYIQPFVTAFGSNMNSGLFHTAAVHKLLGFDVGVRVMVATVPDEDLTYIFQLPSTVPIVNPLNTSQVVNVPATDLYASADLNAPTVFGGDGHTIAPSTSDIEQVLLDNFGIPIGTVPAADLQNIATQASFQVPPGLDFTTIPLVMPQVGLGLPFSSEVTLRFMPTYNIPDVGDINFLGVGLKHQVSKYIPLCPVDISAQVMWQKLTLGDIITNTNTAFNVHASRKLSLLLLSITPYVGVGFESSNIDVTYDIPAGTLPAQTTPIPVEFNLK